MQKVSRREMLKALAATGGGLAAVVAKLAVDSSQSSAQGENSQFIPFISKSGKESTAIPTTQPQESTPDPNATPTQEITRNPCFNACVVQVRNPKATTWTGSNGYFWQNVNQSVVDNMLDQGMMALTGANNIADAWRSILPNYQVGKGIAVKVSFNNSEADCGLERNWIDAITEPVNAMVRGMKAMGVREQDIRVFDANRVIPNRFKAKSLYSGVKFYSRPGTGCGDTVAYSGEYFSFSTPSGGPALSPLPIADVITKATYLINIPILKRHGMAGLSLGFKNHYGSTPDSPESLHEYSSITRDGFTNYYTTYSPLIDLYMNTHIRSKTVLTIGDAIFAAFKNTGDQSIPQPWNTFGNQFPNMLLVSRDPVAIDCVMADWMYLEKPSIDVKAGEHLKLAEAKGLGVWERADPRNPSSYKKIDMQYIQLS